MTREYLRKVAQIFVGLAFSASPVAAQGFAPGGQELFLLDLSRTSIGGFPATIRHLSGMMRVVTKDGMPMLIATEQSEFLITLPSVLPQNFTVEVDIVPKERGGPQPDLTLEGTLQVNQGSASAHLLWTADPNHGFVAVVGGAADNREFPIPDDVRIALPGALNKVGVSVQGSTITCYTNGRQLYAVQAQFARSRYLRITLGGVTDPGGTHPVYLAGVRIATGAPVAVATVIPATTTGTAMPIAGNSANTGALASGPVGGGNPAAAASIASFAAPVSRTIHIAGLTATGVVVGVGALTITLPAIQASGAAPTRGTPTAPTTRTIMLAAVAGTGGSTATPSRSIALPGITAMGGSAAPRSRTISLPGVTASGRH